MKYIGEIIKKYLYELRDEKNEDLKLIKYEKIFKLTNGKDISKIMDAKNIVGRKRRLNYASKAAEDNLMKWPQKISNKWEDSNDKWTGPLDEFSTFSEWKEGVFPKIVPGSDNYKILNMLGETNFEKIFLKINHIKYDYVKNFQNIMDAKFSEKSYSRVLFPISLEYPIYELMNFFFSILKNTSFSERIKSFYENMDINGFEYLIQNGKSLGWTNHIIAEKGIDNDHLRVDIIGFNVILLLKPTPQNKEVFKYIFSKNNDLKIEEIRNDQKRVEVLWRLNNEKDNVMNKFNKIHYNHWRKIVENLKDRGQ